MGAVTATTGGFPVSGSGPLTVRDLEGMPDDGRLAVEVLSPSTALNDLNTKKAAYARTRSS
ncbi:MULTISPECIES: Uma2 family endonuclease [unclassified Mycobacterium]|uniref:Uma2 family endonuclease n=1 Tax=unclassified Mycobacterium TaxID=2642494 RepID=UPI000A527E3D|nr:Uma2 family endonuclease [Mycobacterium sp. ST-F2]